MKQIEKIIQCRDPKKFMEDVNRDLAAGWTVKPKTWDVASITKMPNERTPPHVMKKDGTAVDNVYFVTLISPPQDSDA